MSLPTDNIQYYSGKFNSNSNKIFADGGFSVTTDPSTLDVTRSYAIQSLSSVTFGATTGQDMDSLSGITIPAGVIIYGRFSTISATGSLIIYKTSA